MKSFIVFVLFSLNITLSLAQAPWGDQEAADYGGATVTPTADPNTSTPGSTSAMDLQTKPTYRGQGQFQNEATDYSQTDGVLTTVEQSYTSQTVQNDLLAKTDLKKDLSSVTSVEPLHRVQSSTWSEIKTTTATPVISELSSAQPVEYPYTEQSSTRTEASNITDIYIEHSIVQTQPVNSMSTEPTLTLKEQTHYKTTKSTQQEYKQQNNKHTQPYDRYYTNQGYTQPGNLQKETNFVSMHSSHGVMSTTQSADTTASHSYREQEQKRQNDTTQKTSVYPEYRAYSNSQAKPQRDLTTYQGRSTTTTLPTIMTENHEQRVYTTKPTETVYSHHSSYSTRAGTEQTEPTYAKDTLTGNHVNQQQNLPTNPAYGDYTEQGEIGTWPNEQSYVVENNYNQDEFSMVTPTADPNTSTPGSTSYVYAQTEPTLRGSDAVVNIKPIDKTSDNPVYTYDPNTTNTHQMSNVEVKSLDGQFDKSANQTEFKSRTSKYGTEKQVEDASRYTSTVDTKGSIRHVENVTLQNVNGMENNIVKSVKIKDIEVIKQDNDVRYQQLNQPLTEKQKVISGISYIGEHQSGYEQAKSLELYPDQRKPEKSIQKPTNQADVVSNRNQQRSNVGQTILSDQFLNANKSQYEQQNQETNVGKYTEKQQNTTDSLYTAYGAANGSYTEQVSQGSYAVQQKLTTVNSYTEQQQTIIRPYTIQQKDVGSLIDHKQHVKINSNAAYDQQEAEHSYTEQHQQTAGVTDQQKAATDYINKQQRTGLDSFTEQQAALKSYTDQQEKAAVGSYSEQQGASGTYTKEQRGATGSYTEQYTADGSYTEQQAVVGSVIGKEQPTAGLSTEKQPLAGLSTEKQPLIGPYTEQTHQTNGTQHTEYQKQVTISPSMDHQHAAAAYYSEQYYPYGGQYTDQQHNAAVDPYSIHQGQYADNYQNTGMYPYPDQYQYAAGDAQMNQQYQYQPYNEQAAYSQYQQQYPGSYQEQQYFYPYYAQSPSADDSFHTKENETDMSLYDNKTVSEPPNKPHHKNLPAPELPELKTTSVQNTQQAVSIAPLLKNDNLLNTVSVKPNQNHGKNADNLDHLVSQKKPNVVPEKQLFESPDNKSNHQNKSGNPAQSQVQPENTETGLHLPNTDKTGPIVDQHQLKSQSLTQAPLEEVVPILQTQQPPPKYSHTKTHEQSFESQGQPQSVVGDQINIKQVESVQKTVPANTGILDIQSEGQRHIDGNNGEINVRQSITTDSGQKDITQIDYQQHNYLGQGVQNTKQSTAASTVQMHTKVTDYQQSYTTQAQQSMPVSTYIKQVDSQQQSNDNQAAQNVQQSFKASTDAVDIKQANYHHQNLVNQGLQNIKQSLTGNTMDIKQTGLIQHIYNSQNDRSLQKPMMAGTGPEDVKLVDTQQQGYRQSLKLFVDAPNNLQQGQTYETGNNKPYIGYDKKETEYVNAQQTINFEKHLSQDQHGIIPSDPANIPEQQQPNELGKGSWFPGLRQGNARGRIHPKQQRIFNLKWFPSTQPESQRRHDRHRQPWFPTEGAPGRQFQTDVRHPHRGHPQYHYTDGPNTGPLPKQPSGGTPYMVDGRLTQYTHADHRGVSGSVGWFPQSVDSSQPNTDLLSGVERKHLESIQQSSRHTEVIDTSLTRGEPNAHYDQKSTTQGEKTVLSNTVSPEQVGNRETLSQSSTDTTGITDHAPTDDPTVDPFQEPLAPSLECKLILKLFQVI